MVRWVYVSLRSAQFRRPPDVVRPFPAEPTDEAIYREETLTPGFKGPLRLNTKMDRLYADPFCIYAEEGT